MNVTGMLPFENMIADYVKETNNHVLYRVAPVFDGDDLLAYGVLMEAWSVEDEGDGICFNVFVYNVQPDIVIDYAKRAIRMYKHWQLMKLLRKIFRMKETTRKSQVEQMLLCHRSLLNSQSQYPLGQIIF